MYITTAELKQEVRNELQCPMEFIKHLTRWNTFKELKKAHLSEDSRNLVPAIMDEIYDGYKDYCLNTGLDYDADNRKARPNYFINI